MNTKIDWNITKNIEKNEKSEIIIIGLTGIWWVDPPIVSEVSGEKN
jgi:hypothetical protein